MLVRHGLGANVREGRPKHTRLRSSGGEHARASWAIQALPQPGRSQAFKYAEAASQLSNLLAACHWFIGWRPATAGEQRRCLRSHGWVASLLEV